MFVFVIFSALDDELLFSCQFCNFKTIKFGLFRSHLSTKHSVILPPLPVKKKQPSVSYVAESTITGKDEQSSPAPVEQHPVKLEAVVDGGVFERVLLPNDNDSIHPGFIVETSMENIAHSSGKSLDFAQNIDNGKGLKRKRPIDGNYSVPQRIKNTVSDDESQLLDVNSSSAVRVGNIYYVDDSTLMENQHSFGAAQLVSFDDTIGSNLESLQKLSSSNDVLSSDLLGSSVNYASSYLSSDETEQGKHLLFSSADDKNVLLNTFDGPLENVFSDNPSPMIVKNISSGGNGNITVVNYVDANSHIISLNESETLILSPNETDHTAVDLGHPPKAAEYMQCEGILPSATIQDLQSKRVENLSSEEVNVTTATNSIEDSSLRSRSAEIAQNLDSNVKLVSMENETYCNQIVEDYNQLERTTSTNTRGRKSAISKAESTLAKVVLTTTPSMVITNFGKSKDPTTSRASGVKSTKERPTPRKVKSVASSSNKRHSCSDPPSILPDNHITGAVISSSTTSSAPRMSAMLRGTKVSTKEVSNDVTDVFIKSSVRHCLMEKKAASII